MRVRAALFEAPGVPLVVREIDLEGPGPGDALVRIDAVGICGSDLHVVKGEWVRPRPMVLGHEGAGVVEALGADVEGLEPGDRVILSWAPACGECGPCLAGRTTACLPLRAGIGAGTLPDGTTRLSDEGETIYRMTAVGALAERVVMPASGVLKLTHDLPADEAALLGCAALTGIGAARGVTAGDVVVVIGAGGVGQFCVQGSRLRGASAIVSVDPLPARRALARAVGATHDCDPSDLAELLAGLAPDGADCALEAVGSPATAALALASVRPGGRATLVGMPPAGARLDLDPAEFTNREKVLTGTVYGSGDPADALPSLLADVAAGRVLLTPLVGPTFPLERAEEAIQAALAGEPGRVIVAPGDAHAP
jgi:Zn-dependent alcohol dehydrogenase